MIENYHHAPASPGPHLREAYMCKWQPIETAPKVFTVIDLWAGGKRYTDCVWSKPTYSDEICWIQLNASYDSDGPIDEPVHSPTHWMPIPEPPND